MRELIAAILAALLGRDMRDVRGSTEMRFRRDNRATAAARRAFRFERDDES
jgi:hypothetical protein